MVAAEAGRARNCAATNGGRRGGAAGRADDGHRGRDGVHRQASRRGASRHQLSGGSPERVDGDQRGASGIGRRQGQCVMEAVGDTVKSAEELRERLATLRSRPARWLNDLGWQKALGFVALVLVVPPLIAWLTSRILGRTEVGQALSLITTTLVVI